MPNFKPKDIIPRVFKDRSRKKKDSLDYLCYGFESFLLESYPHLYCGRPAEDDDYDDKSSISSFSTTATADDLPGTGRTVDTYLYQPAGRWVERLAMRCTISSLHPDRIARYIEAESADFYPAFADSWTLKDAIAKLCQLRNGSTMVAGMKSLVNQAQSNSVHRSASALSALIRVSLSEGRREIYVNISRIKSIFQLETLSESLASSRQEKQYLLLLVKLGRATLLAVRNPVPQASFDPVLRRAARQLWPSSERALGFRQRLIRILDVYKVSGFDTFDDILGEAYAICAEALSTCIDDDARGKSYIHILGTVYFTIAFILRSINELAHRSCLLDNKHIHMVLGTLSYWIDTFIYRCLYAVNTRPDRFDVESLEAGLAFRSLVLVNKYTARSLLPASLAFISQNSLIDESVLPRRLRIGTNRGENNPLFHSFIGASIRRTQRLLGSFDELEREICGRSSGINSFTCLKMEADPLWLYLNCFGQDWWERWKRSLERAQGVNVRENKSTEDFREARRIGLECDPADEDKWEYEFDDRNWAYHQLHHGSRHRWGQYLRSNMEWDWDLATCMNRLFKVENQAREQPSPASLGE